MTKRNHSAEEALNFEGALKMFNKKAKQSKVPKKGVPKLKKNIKPVSYIIYFVLRYIIFTLVRMSRLVQRLLSKFKE